ncbi:MAG: MotA/TolQ/ExbB proton channel family protein [Lentisphaeria bacterium]|jgi:hypothetical protein|nr:MotA/TolQ/ExbB proton channel family protein [Lentisphaeria bacterium]MDP7740064.1 MotA/TolQ/ExbB proton channel family protein [Lentisphaeria bacterium]
MLAWATINVGDTLDLVWSSLGVFRYLFAVALLAIAVFLFRGWRELGRAACPFDLAYPLDNGTRSNLWQLVHHGMASAQVRGLFFAGDETTGSNLFYQYLVRFGSRDCQAPLSPSLLQGTEESYRLLQIRNVSVSARFLAALLPAIGLLGTLIGMFNAFFGTDFTEGTELATTMQQLMQNFALALFTTIAAVILKIGVDLFNHFTLETHIDRTRGDVAKLRSVLQDLLSQSEPRPAGAPAPAEGCSGNGGSPGLIAGND